MPSDSLTLGLFEPGLTHLHRAGLAGLALSLRALDPGDFKGFGSWSIDRHSITLTWQNAPEPFFQRLLEKTFTVDGNGMIALAAHRKLPMGDLKRLLLHEAMLRSFLQHPKSRKTEKSEKTLNIQFDEKIIIQKIKPVKSYRSQKIEECFSKGLFEKEVEVKGWWFPGAIKRHDKVDQSSLTQSGQQLFLLMFSPVGSLFFRLVARSADGKTDKKKGVAVVVPHYSDLDEVTKRYERYLEAPVERMYVAGLADAAMTGLYHLRLQRAGGMLESVGVDSCTVFTMGTVPWSKQQKTRTGGFRLDHVPQAWLGQFGLCLQCLGSSVHLKKDGGFWGSAAQARELFAGNIAAGREWFSGFGVLMRTKELAKYMSYERKGLNDMVEQAAWSQEADKLFVEAVHAALRSMYGQLAQKARDRGEIPRFDREFERLRSALMRAKNRQTVRAELADLFARGRLNQKLQEHWAKLLPLFTGPDWQRAKDLALLGLASYQGAGLNDPAENQEEEHEEELE